MLKITVTLFLYELGGRVVESFRNPPDIAETGVSWGCRHLTTEMVSNAFFCSLNHWQSDTGSRAQNLAELIYVSIFIWKGEEQDTRNLCKCVYDFKIQLFTQKTIFSHVIYYDPRKVLP